MLLLLLLEENQQFVGGFLYFYSSILFRPSRVLASSLDYDGQCIFLFQNRLIPNRVQIAESIWIEYHVAVAV